MSINLSPAQKKWLKKLNDSGFVECGGWNKGQRNRPLRELVRIGLAYESSGPYDSFLKVDGYMPTAQGPRLSLAQSETITSVISFLYRGTL